MSVYSAYYIGRKMANGQKYRPDRPTVASNDWKLGTRLRLTSKHGSLVVTVTDRMAKRFNGKRIDASSYVWKVLSGNAKPGLVKVQVVRMEANP